MFFREEAALKHKELLKNKCSSCQLGLQLTFLSFVTLLLCFFFFFFFFPTIFRTCWCCGPNSVTIGFKQDLGPRQSYYCHVFEQCSWNERNLVDFFCNQFPLSLAAAVGISSPSCLLIRRAVYPIHFTHLPISIISILVCPLFPHFSVSLHSIHG